jgi:hypothetical protein
VAVEVRIHSFLNSVVDIYQPSAPAAFTPTRDYPMHIVLELNVIILACGA